MYLLDTNVISETRRGGGADRGVLEWLDRVGANDWQISVVTDYELELGLAAMRRRDERQAALLQVWLAGARKGYESRMLPVTADIGRICAALQVPDRRQLTDALIAATALHHGLTVVTRNVKDFEVPGLAVIDPFSG